MFEFLENDLGLAIVKFLQEGWWGEVLWYLLYPFHIIGSETGFLIILPIIYWSINKSAGQRLFILALTATIITGILKGWWHRPRPYHVAPDQIDPISTSPEPGLPSGHTIFGTITGLWILNYFRNRRIAIYMILLIVLMGLSRLVHGVHYPQDVVLGWILGGLFFWIYLKTELLVVKGFKRIFFPGKVLFALILWIAGFILIVTISQEYETRKALLSPLGALVGGIGGIFLEARFLQDANPKKMKHRILRGGIGILLLLAIYISLDLGYYAIFEGNHSITALSFYSLRYMLVGLTVTWLAPFLFNRLKV